MTSTDWIEPGMTVVIYSSRATESATALVERLTATQIVLRGTGGQELRYRRDNGHKCGDHYGGGELRPTTDPAFLAQQREVRQRRAIGSVRAAADALRHNTGTVGLEGLVKLRKMVDQAIQVFEQE